ncbi:MAG: helix-turn-helix transcriptional regulator [Gammaproteobacteria bacterium]|nr:MAG: helix-turn-helix transcriptional regulator [Gammaproteobacteria bacterium]
MTSLNTNLYILHSDGEQKKVEAELDNQYTCRFFLTVDDCLANLDEGKVNLLLCGHDFLDEKDSTVLKDIKLRNAGLTILVIGAGCDVDVQIDLLKKGARGYFDSSSSLDKLSEALQAISYGGVWIEHNTIEKLADESANAPEVTAEQQLAVDSLSPKELEVAKLVCYGSTNKMIAKAMTITERTVKAHLTAIFQKMNMHDRLSVAIFFRDLR